MTTPITCEPLTFHPDESGFRYVDLSPILNKGVERYLSSVATPSDVDATGDLTIASEAVITTPLTKSDGSIIRALKAVKFSVSGQLTGTTYSIQIQATCTDSSVVVVLCPLVGSAT